MICCAILRLSYPVLSIDERLNAIYAKAGVSLVWVVKGIKERRTLAKQPLLHQPGEALLMD
ncbi:hypothetical protein CS542_09945 [Pedobacter sp. IW39]|nr:hypothetical protein CS542_09945 [Pedobacter sp. IW39]